jgi:hypothetical protein
MEDLLSLVGFAYDRAPSALAYARLTAEGTMIADK